MSSPLVSIGIPTRDRPQWIEESIRSALAQTHPNLEVIISDNSVGHETRDICARLAKEDPRVRWVQNPGNPGVVHNINEPFRHARGEYLLWLGDDDWFEPNYVATCLDALTSTPGAVFAIGQIVFHIDDDSIPPFAAGLASYTQRHRWARALAICGTLRYIGSFYGVFRRDTLPFPPLSNAISFDWKFTMDLAMRGTLLAVPGTTMHRRMRSTTSYVDRIALADAMRLSPTHRWFYLWAPNLMQAALVYRWLRGDQPLLALLAALLHFAKTCAYTAWRLLESLLLAMIGRERTKALRYFVIRRILGKAS